LLPDQAVQPLPRDNHVLNFLDAEAAVEGDAVLLGGAAGGAGVGGPGGSHGTSSISSTAAALAAAAADERDEILEHELAASDRRCLICSIFFYCIRDTNLLHINCPSENASFHCNIFRVKKEIRHLEAEVSKWQVMVDKVHGCATPDFDAQTLAVLRGRLVRYLMRSKEV
jgi:hypothetical protein